MQLRLLLKQVWGGGSNVRSEGMDLRFPKRHPLILRGLRVLSGIVGGPMCGRKVIGHLFRNFSR